MSRVGAFRLTAKADADIAGILEQTAIRFGLRQHDAYARLLDSAIRMVADDPMRPGSRDRGDLMPGVRAFHLELAARRRGAAAHLLFYLADQDTTGGVLILRVLHQAMDPRSRLHDMLD